MSHISRISGTAGYESESSVNLQAADVRSANIRDHMMAVPPPLPPQRIETPKDDALPGAAVASSGRSSGLPRAYVAGWAVLAIASTAYLGLTVAGTPGGKRHTDRLAESSEATETDRSIRVSAQDPVLAERLAQKRESLAEVVAELAKPPVFGDDAGKHLASSSEPTPIVTHKVQTMRLEAAPAPEVAVLNAPTPPITPPAPAIEVASSAQPPAGGGTAAITTGSIGRLPPPPLRAPAAPPEFLKARAEAKAAAEAKAKLAALEKQKAAEAAARATPVVFGPATINRNDPQTASSSSPSGAAQPVVPVAAAPTAGSRPVLGADIGVRLATAPSIDALRLQWTLLRERHGPQLAGLSPRYVQASANGIGASYELIAGPVPGTIEALEICQDVVRNGGARCIIGDYVGNAL